MILITMARRQTGTTCAFIGTSYETMMQTKKSFANEEASFLAVKRREDCPFVIYFKIVLSKAFFLNKILTVKLK